MPTVDETWAEIDAAERKSHAEYELRTVGAVVGGREVKVAELRTVFERYVPPEKADWKAPIDVCVRGEHFEVFLAAVRFYQGCEPHARVMERFHGRRIPAGERYRVTSPGYVC